MSYYKWIGLLLWSGWGLMTSTAQGQTGQVNQRFVFGDDRSGYTTVGTEVRYKETHPFGYAFNTTPKGAEPFSFSVKAGEGNYRITVEIETADTDALLTPKSESR